jgi:[calcium/calmodulin-dependent protein kinase] kinase
VSEIFERDNDMMTRSAGSPAFMAPEQISIEYHEYSGRLTDIWSMGVTLYCMCYGRLPFIGSTFAEMYEAIRNNTPNIPDDDPRLHDLLTRLLEKDPKKRINMSDLREHPWVTDDGRCPLPTREENCQQIEVTEEDVANAVSSAKQLFNAAFFLSAVARLKRIKNRRSIGCTITPGEVQHILQHGITSPTSHDQTDENNEDTKASDTDGSPESSCGELLSGEDTADSTSTTQTSVSDAGEEGDVSATSTSYSDSLSVQVSEDLSQAVIDKLEIKSPEIILVPEQPDAPSEE